MNEQNLTAIKAIEASANAIKDRKRLEKEFGEEPVRWAIDQLDLRRRAQAKFARAGEMFFVREALEQATHEAIAQYHASLFPPEVKVLDMTCGIGADLIALSRDHQCTGYDLSSDRLQIARHNLDVHEVKATLVEGDSTTAVTEFDYVFADPARRVEGRRTLSVDDFSPHPAKLVEQFANKALWVMKLTPLLSDTLLLELAPRIEFVSYGGECREALLMGGRNVQAGVFALHLETNQTLPRTAPIETQEWPGTYVFDSDPAAVRAHALGNLGHKGLGTSNGYLTGDEIPESPWIRPYRVLYSGKADEKTTKKALRDLNVAVFEVKQRGSGVNGDTLRRKFTASGKPVSLLVWNVGPSLRYALVESVT